MRTLLIILGLCTLTGCDDKEAPNPELKTAELSEQERADNPLLKMQDNTTKRAENAVNDALEKQQQALDSIGQ